MTVKEYTVEINGLPHTMQLSDEDAKRLGVAETKSRAPQNKARTVENKG